MEDFLYQVGATMRNDTHGRQKVTISETTLANIICRDTISENSVAGSLSGAVAAHDILDPDVLVIAL